ncbi:MAG: acetyl-CoA carboxylase carboxyl transferase subunit beta [Planctomycetota bacterium]|jgi:acetyl-CoA carboxylase carboxyl transferase subunit beta
MADEQEQSKDEPIKGNDEQAQAAASSGGSSKKSSRKASKKAAEGEAEAGSGDDAAAEPAQGRMSRLRFKKKDMPGGLWLKCPECATTIYRKELEEKDHVCPACTFHFTLPGSARIVKTLDEGSWSEEFAELTTLDRLSFKDSIPYGDKVAKAVKRTGNNEAFLSGIGRIQGRPIVLGVLDFSFLGGSMGEVVGEKISLAADLARARKLPLILFTSSGGARMHEGMLSLMQMAKTCSALADLRDAGGFSICVMTNPTTGGVTASFASVCDLTLAEPSALIGFAGPRVIASTIKQELPPGFQRSEFLLEKGQIDMIVSRIEMRARLSQLIDYGTASWEGYARRIIPQEASELELSGSKKSAEPSAPEAGAKPDASDPKIDGTVEIKPQARPTKRD